MRVPLPSSLKQTLKQVRHDLRKAYFRRFFAFTPADFVGALRRLGVQQGDIVCAHSSFNQFLGFQGSLGDALNALKETVGQNGGLMMPTQPFSGSAIDYVKQNPVTNIGRAPS